jgi:uncharacterized membrane protein
MEFLANLHPLVVHFPVAFFILYFLFESTGIILRKDFLSKSAFIVLGLGVFFAVCAVLTGNQALDVAKIIKKNDLQLNELIETHQQYATITLWYFFVVLIFRTYILVKKKFNTGLKYVFIFLALIGCYLIYETGSHGGNLVFQNGVGTQLFGK